MANILKPFFLVLLLALSSSSFAASSSSDVDLAAASVVDLLNTDKNDNDYFHSILEYMWGSFIFENNASDINEVTTLSMAAGFANYLAIIFGIVITSYVILASVINSATSGEVLGKSWSAAWLPIRTAGAYGLIIPTSAGAYTLSTAQVLVIKLIIIASTCATFLWETTVRDMFSVPNKQEVLSTAGYPYKSAYDISSMAFCSAGYLYISSHADDADSDTKSFITIFQEDGIQNSHSRYVGNQSSSQIREFTRGGLDVSDFANLSSVKEDNLITRIEFADGKCGAIEFSIPEDLVEDGEETKALDRMLAMNEQRRKLMAENQKSILEYFTAVYNHAQNLAGSWKDENDSNMTSHDPLNNGTNITMRKGFDDIILMLIQESSTTNVGGSMSNSNVTKNLRRKIYNNRSSDNFLLLTEVFINSYLDNVEKVYVSSLGVDKLEGKDIDISDEFDEITEIENNFSSSDEEYKRITKGGWIMAGGAFFKMSDYISLGSSSFASLASTSPAMPSAGCDPDDDEDSSQCIEQKFLTASAALIDKYFKVAYENDSAYREFYTDNIDRDENKKELSSRFTTARNTALSSVNNTLSSGDPNGFVKRQSNMISQSVLNIVSALDFGASISRIDQDAVNIGMVTPYQDAVSLGHGMMTIRTITFTIATIMNVTIKTTDYIQGSVSNNVVNFFVPTGTATGIGAGLLYGVLSSFLPVLYALIAMITAMAWTLAYYLPMMPVILWVTLVSAYVLIVIEAVVATPLAVIMAATPEGEGISGQRMEAAIKMLASVLLRPSLMIIGLFASIYISKITYVIFLSLFWPQAETYVGDGLFSTFAIIIIFITVLHQILSKSIIVMDTLPSAILGWIGGGGDREFGQKGTESLSSTVEQSGTSMEQASNSMMSAAKSRRDDLRRAQELKGKE
ncbi:DotA/TraY family protein [Pseudoalteromonas sp. OFAV1]|uniref:DotA/TraY family protein n=1 Tax=Pseudoalteromonas sp. OFAV1 TaxID=2908892 RepID=UPI001F3845E2|nr:DotA/TraY family protein [Pseudoalteromonas sp. OFAV1]MCF2901874.1 DotA/TraY family protein [Pseudoalteromonas sp. OFAV1]